MATNKRQTHGNKKCPNVHFTPIYAHRPCTYHMECVTCPECLSRMERLVTYDPERLLRMLDRPFVQMMMDTEDSARAQRTLDLTTESR